MMRKVNKAARKRRSKNADSITIDVLVNGLRQKEGKRNDYVITQVSRKSFRVKLNG